jgi:hypothetical protein
MSSSSKTKGGLFGMMPVPSLFRRITCRYRDATGVVVSPGMTSCVCLFVMPA